MGRDDRRTKVKGRVPFARWAVLAAVPAVAAVVLSGCSGSSGEQVLTSDERPERGATAPDVEGAAGGDPAAVLTAAAVTLETSGRFHGDVEVGGLATVTQDGEFSGSDVAVRTTAAAGAGLGEMFGEAFGASGGSDADQDLSMEMRSVGGRVYLSTGDTWVAADTSGSGIGAPVGSPAQLAQTIRSLEGVVAGGTDTVDGESVDVYRGTTTLSELGGAFGGAGSVGSMPEGVDLPASLQRIERVNQRIRETLEVEVSVAVDDQGRLRRLSVATGGELPDDLADCALLEGPLSTAYDLSATFTFADLDTDITIEAPDPSTVTELDTGFEDVDPAEIEGAFDEAFGEAFGDEGLAEAFGEGFGEGFGDLAGGMVDKLLEGCPS